jgi:4a-hydroxytetrahydrobiopterin dehydratase
MSLVDKKCITKGLKKLDEAGALALQREVPEWVLEGDTLVRKFLFKDFVQTIAFVNELAKLAESENHHPDFTVRYNKLEISTWTHDVNGLSENDFILAAKIDRLHAR